MDRRDLARTVLAADGAGCAAAAFAVLCSDRVLGAVDPSLRSRRPVALALGVTSAVLLAGAARARPRAEDLTGAAVMNAGWVATCLLALAGRPSAAGAALLTGTAVFDATAAALQWYLKPRGGSRAAGRC